MSDNFREIRRVLLPVLAVLASTYCLPLNATPTDIHNEPLANAVSTTNPNIMFTLDDSGSMMWHHSPDYAFDYTMFNTNGTVSDDNNNPICFDYKDDDGVITTTSANGTASAAKLKTCSLGDPPLMSAQFNKQYYNPAIRYRPAVNYDGTERNSMTAANTANWTAVPTDAFGVQNRNLIENERDRLNTAAGSNTTNLMTEFPDRVWCVNTTASLGDLDDVAGTLTGIPNAPLCVKNSAYSYPNNVYGYGRQSDSSRTKFVFGAPYYYTIPATEYCTTANLVTCVAANADGSNPDSTTYPYPATIRWCSNSGTTAGGVNTFASCQGKRISGFTYPKTFGRVVSSAGTPATPATATLTVTSGADNVRFTISSLSIDGVNILSSATSYGSNNVVKTSGSPEINANDGLNATNERISMAQAIANAINNISATTGYTASTAGNNVVTIQTAATGAEANGKLAVVGATIVPVTAATATISVEGVSNGSSITNLTANGTALIGNTVVCNYTNSSTNRNNCAQNLTSAINAYTGTSGYSAVRSGSTVTVTAPLSAGATANGWHLVETGTVITNADSDALPPEFRLFGGGASNVTMPHTITAFSGGAEATPALAPTRVGVAPFARVDIVDGQTYPKAEARTDCVATPGVCTYAEEMTNFANWYAYYRTRMQMMKTATGRAFASLPDTYRVGFITINPGSPVQSSRYLSIADFAGGANNQRDKWYQKLYAQTNHGGTPLREALSRIGWIYAGKLATGLTNGIAAADDPVQYSCQPNFSILSTDGYWNGNGGKDLDGNALVDVDGVENANFSKQQDGVYDALQSPNTLSDAAFYFYKNDLRPSMTDNVRTSSRDSAQHQHMTTFTLGLGLDGTLTYDKNYETQTSGDFKDITQGTIPWPAPSAEQPSALDDLWHAAVSGRGKFFSAGNPQELSSGLADTLASLEVFVGAGAAAATSNLQPVAGDNFAFTAEYKTVAWSGDLKARTIDLSAGVVSSVSLWSARNLLDAKSWNTRKIYTFDPADTIAGGGNQMKSFCWPGAVDAACNDGSGLSATEQAYFAGTSLVQYSSMTAAQQSALTGNKLVDFLRGDRSNEVTGGTAVTDLFRERESVLGDFISAQPVYDKASGFSYTDNNYGNYKVCTAGYIGPTASQPSCPADDFPDFPNPRRGTVYAAANDGMLHAFETDVNNDPYYQTAGISTPETSDDVFVGDNSGNGEERWAYIPSMLLPDLHKLAESPYSHRYFVDGSPTVGDICKGTCSSIADWRTILVGGLNAGGRGYYALDVTNPESPKALWELTSSTTCLTDAQAESGAFSSDCHIGLSYGNPLITKRKVNDKWVVIVSSGLNNFNPGDGKGYLYILDAYTGKILKRISTGVGTGGTAPNYSDATPSGLSKINGWTDNGSVNNLTLAVYGGDLQGNVWRFELDNEKAGYNTAIKIATLTDSSGVAQPVTTKPELAYVNGYRVVYIGTGKYLGTDDPEDSSEQTVYAIRDDMSNTTVDARASTVAQTLGDGAAASTRTTTSSNSVDWATQKGWRVDLPDSGERVNVDPLLQLGTLTVASNVPHVDVCESGGYSFLNFFSIVDGKAINVAGTPISSYKIAGALIVGVNVVQLPGGVVKAIVTTADNQNLTMDNPTPAASFTGRRVSWRELIYKH